jgi:hypothetical protein
VAQDLSEYRASQREQERIKDLFGLIPESGLLALDIGARDGFLSRQLAQRFDRVIALDIDQPNIDHPRIQPVKGDVTHLEFEDATIDLILCAEVLEHIPPALLDAACKEIARVACGTVVIGVPYKQDLRCGETTCYTCGKPNPPWGHVNSFDEQRFSELFPGLQLIKYAYVGSVFECTNSFSAALLRYAGNPYGTYMQDEPCIHCGATLKKPPARHLAQKVATRIAFWANALQAIFGCPKANWIHAQFKRVSN